MLKFSKRCLQCCPDVFLPIDFSKSIDKMLHICFNFGLVKFETSMKIFGNFKLASSLTVRDAIFCRFPSVIPQGAKDYDYAVVENRSVNNITLNDSCRSTISRLYQQCLTTSKPKVTSAFHLFNEKTGNI